MARCDIRHPPPTSRWQLLANLVPTEQKTSWQGVTSGIRLGAGAPLQRQPGGARDDVPPHRRLRRDAALGDGLRFCRKASTGGACVAAGTRRDQTRHGHDCVSCPQLLSGGRPPADAALSGPAPRPTQCKAAGPTRSCPGPLGLSRPVKLRCVERRVPATSRPRPGHVPATSRPRPGRVSRPVAGHVSSARLAVRGVHDFSRRSCAGSGASCWAGERREPMASRQAALPGKRPPHLPVLSRMAETAETVETAKPA